MSETAKTVLLGIAGLVVAIGLSIATLQLTNQRVGISAEPVDAGRDLAAASERTGPTPEAKKNEAKPKKQTEKAETPRTNGSDSTEQSGNRGSYTPPPAEGGEREGDSGGGEDDGGDGDGDDD